jgi:hypothetical protein
VAELKTPETAPLVKTAEQQLGSSSVTTPHLVNALVNEVVRSRVRFRALVRLLIAKGLISEQEYVTEYEAEQDASFIALADILLLDSGVAKEKHRAWLVSERGRFAAMSGKRNIPRVTLTPETAME